MFLSSMSGYAMTTTSPGHRSGQVLHNQAAPHKLDPVLVRQVSRPDAKSLAPWRPLTKQAMASERHRMASCKPGSNRGWVASAVPE
jgi:hypothetical protein